MESLRGKHVLVVGATGDIGTHTARLLQSSGASLFLLVETRWLYKL